MLARPDEIHDPRRKIALAPLVQVHHQHPTIEVAARGGIGPDDIAQIVREDVGSAGVGNPIVQGEIQRPVDRGGQWMAIERHGYELRQVPGDDDVGVQVNRSRRVDEIGNDKPVEHREGKIVVAFEIGDLVADVVRDDFGTLASKQICAALDQTRV